LAAYTALLDACVLYPQTLRDVLLSLARTEIFRARWSAQIAEEWVSKRLEKQPDRREKIEQTARLVNQSVPDCLITGYEPLIPSLVLPDPKDRHVVAAAIVGRADVIVTLDMRHFPAEVLAPYNIEVQHPDEFIVHQLGLDRPNALSAFKSIRARYKNPAMTAAEFLDSLEKKGLAGTVSTLRPYEELI
jgi:predicted nucleic acid-binding protein